MKDSKKVLVNYVNSQRLMALSTCSDKPWISYVFYANDENFNLYFISEPDSKHCKDIEKNKDAACMIAESSQIVTDKKVGVQIQGVVSEVKNKLEIISALKIWNKKNPGFENIINIKNMKKIIKSRVYKVKPTQVKFFNEELYGEEGFEVFKF